MSVGSSTALSGLSGYDFSAIVDNLVTLYSAPGNKLVSQQSKLQSTKDAWRDVNTRLSSLNDKLDDLLSASTWKATQTSSTNTGIVKATSTSSALKGAYDVHVSSVARSQTVSSTTIAASDTTTATTLAAGEFTIKVGETTKTVNIEANASLQDIADAINDADAGVHATLFKVSGGYKIAVMSDKTGTANQAEYTDVSGGFLSSIGMIDPLGDLNETQVAKDTKITVNGITDIISSTNKIDSAIPGVTLEVFSESATAADIATISVTADYSVAQTKVQAFVGQYNSVMSFIDTKMNYNADTGITGDLYGDPALRNIKDRLRSLVSQDFSSASTVFKTFSELGIATSGDNFGKDFNLEFDTAKFQKAMENNSEAVANLFGTSTVGTEFASNQGAANILRSYLDPLVKYGGVLDTKEDGYQRRLDDIKDRIEAFNLRVDAYSERLRLKYAALETALASLNSQSTSLTSMIQSMESQLGYNNND